MKLEREAMSVAGMTSEESDSLGRPDGYGCWPTPLGVQLEGDRLAWTDEGPPVTSRADMLEDFVRLADQDNRHIVCYAQRWGTLNICGQHGLPASHLPDRYAHWLDPDQRHSCRPERDFWSGRRSEPLAAWRRYSEQAKVILNIAARLNDPRPEQAPADMWEHLVDLRPSQMVAGLIGGELVGNRRRLVPVAEQRSALAYIIEGWLELGDVHVRFDWEDQPHFDLGGGNLFGAIGLQLALATAKRGGLAICDECGRFFVPKRQNRPGVPRRCPQVDCRQRAAKRKSAQRRRARERGES